MSEHNGSHVTWRELNLLRETIDTRFDDLEAGIVRIERKLTDRKQAWRAWGPALIAALISSGIAFPVAFLH